MALGAEAVIALFALLLALPPAIAIVWRWCKCKWRAEPCRQHIYLDGMSVHSRSSFDVNLLE